MQLLYDACSMNGVIGDSKHISFPYVAHVTYTKQAAAHRTHRTSRSTDNSLLGVRPLVNLEKGDGA